MNCLGGPDSATLGLQCSGGLTCDGLGQCSSPSGNTLPSQEVTLASDPPGLNMIPDDSGAWPTRNVTISVTTINQVIGTQPAPVVRAVPHADLLLACDATSTLSETECTIDGASWTFVQQTTPQGTAYVASRAIRVRVKAGSTAQSWLLNLTTLDGTKQSEVHAVRPDVEVEGRYRGVLTMGDDAPSTTLAIQATVTASAIVLHDPTRVVSPTGTVLLPKTGAAKATSFLAGTKEPKLYNKHTAKYRLVTITSSFDPDLGQLMSGTAAVQLASSQDREENWTFALTRTGPLKQQPCPPGETFDTAQQACLLGVPWDDTAHVAPAVVHDQATRWIDAMASVTNDPLLSSTAAAPLAERLLCYDKTQSVNRGFLAVTSPVSGDLACGGSGDTFHGWWGVGLVSYRDRAPIPPIEQLDLLAACVDQIRSEPPTTPQLSAIDNDSCVSLARFFPALFAVAGSGPYRLAEPLSGAPQDDRRNRLLLMRLLQQWAELTGFIANNGAAQRNAADMLAVVRQLTPNALNGDELRLVEQKSNFTYEALLDVVDRAWTLVLDKRIHEPLQALPAAELAAPDYRTLHRPSSYWTFEAGSRAGTTVNSITGGPALTAVASCPYLVDDWSITWAACKYQTALERLDKDLTVALRVRYAGATGLSTLFDSDGLLIQVSTSSPTARPVLFVGHRIAGGAVEGATFKLIIPQPDYPSSFVDAPLVVRRDARAKVYLVSGDRMQDSEMSLRASYSTPPAVAGTTVAIGGGRSLQTMNGWVSQVAIWNYMLSEAETQSLRSAYRRKVARAAWPAEVTLPGSEDRIANEATVGLPALWLESLIPTMRLIEAYLKDAALVNTATCRQGFIDDSVRRAEERAGRSLRVSYAILQLARTLHDRAVSAGNLSWAVRYDQAAAEFFGARSKAIAALSNAEACQNPIGIGPKEFPLYFATADVSLPANLLEASAYFLKDLAGTSTAPKTAIGDASAALTAARDAWRNQYTSTVQDTIGFDEDIRRTNGIRSAFGRDLVDLCGVPGEDGISVLRRFTDAANPHPLTAANCFIQEGLCAGSEQLPLDSINPACFRGQVGEAWLAARSASQRVVRARAVWDIARKAQQLWNRHCAEQEAKNHAARDFSNELRDLESAEAKEDRWMQIAVGVAEVAVGVVVAVVSTGGAAAASVPLIVAGGEKIISGGKGLLDGTDRKAALQALLRNRSLDQADEACRHQAELARVPMDGAEQDIPVALADLTVALAHGATLQKRVASTVIEAQAALAREAQLTRPRLTFHYWADEALEIFRSRMARARRMTYLYLRAVEHDLQRGYGLDASVLGAVHPEQLNAVALQLEGELLHGMEQRGAGAVVKVVSLCNDVLHLPELNHEATCDEPKSIKRFREILFSPSNAKYEAGDYLGQAIPFRLTPELLGVSDECAERLWAVDAQIVGDFGGGLLDLKLDKRETFYSETCRDHIDAIGSIQEGTLRSSNNLFVDGHVSEFSLDREFSRAPMQALVDSADPQFPTRGLPGEHASTALAGRGIFGDYVFIVPAIALNHMIESPDVRDVRIRFDFVAIENNGPVVPSGSRQLETELRDGNGQVINAATGNSVNPSCTTCTRGATSVLTAAPAAGWHFGGWAGACVGSSTTCSVVMEAPHKAWATFVDDRTSQVNVTLAGTGSGQIASGWTLLTNGSQSGAKDSVVHLIARPALNSYFEQWIGACTGSGACDLTLSAAALNVTAKFAPKPTLTINVAAPGSDAWQSGGAGLSAMANHCFENQCTFAFAPNEQANLLGGTDIGDTTWSVLSWAGDCSGNASCALTMSGNKTVTANLRPRVFVRASPVPPNGFIVFPAYPWLYCGLTEPPTPCGSSYLADTNLTLIAEQYQAGVPFHHWTGDASACGSNPQCTFTVRPNMNVSAVFQAIGGGGGGGGCFDNCQ